MSRVRELTRLRNLALKATGQGVDKWQSNAELITWFRSNPVAVIDLCLAAARWDTRQGGLNNQALKTALAALPEVKKEDAA